MPNMYNTPIQGTPTNNYVSQHTDLPLDTMERVLEARQGEYNATENLGIAERTRLGGIQAIGGWADGVLAGKEKELDDFTKGYDGKDLGSSEVSTAFKQKISDLSADKDLQNIQQFGAKYKEYQANSEAMRKSGDYFVENDYQNSRALARYSQNGDSTGFDSVIDKGVNIQEEAQKYFTALGPDSYETMRSISDGQGGSVYYDNKTGGISSGKITGQAGRVFHEFESSQAGKQGVRRFLMEQGLDRDAMENPKVAQAAQQYLAKILLNAGAGYQQTTQSSGLSAAFNTKQAKADKKKEKSDELSTTQISMGESPSNNKLPEFDANDNIVGSGTSIDAFNEGLANGMSPTEAIKQGWRQFTGSGKYQTDADKKQYMPQMDALAHVNETRIKNKEKPFTQKEWLVTANKKVNHSVNAANDKKVQDMYQNMLVDNRGIMGLTAIPQGNTADRNNTFDSVARTMLGIGPKDPISKEQFESLQIKVGSVPSSISGVSRKAVAVNMGGSVFYGNLDDGRNPNLVPKTKQERIDHNLFEIGSAQAGGGTYTFDGFNPTTGEIVKTKVIPNIMNGSNDLFQLDPKTKKWIPMGK